MIPSLGLLVLIIALQVPATGPTESTGLPLQGEEAERFLSTASVVGIEQFETKGITKPRCVTLSDGGDTFRALFKVVDQQVPRATGNRGRSLIWLKDSYKHEIAAYELDKLLGLGIVPPCVERTIRGDRGALCLWVEGAITEWERRNVRKLEPPDPQGWNKQMYVIRLFHQLTWDTDYNNINNLLVDGNWRLYKIDSSRAFRRDRELRREESLQRFSRSVLEALRRLQREEVESRLGPWLDRRQIDGLMARRDAILETAERLVAERGEAAVLYD